MERKEVKETKDCVGVTCDKCGYRWNYSGNMIFATCPNCYSKTRVDKQNE